MLPNTVLAPPFGKLITRLRNERGLRQRDLADLAGLASSTVGNVEQHGEHNLRPVTARQLYDALASALPLRPEEIDQFNAATGLRIQPPREAGPVLSPRRAISLQSAEELIMPVAEQIGLDKLVRILDILAEPPRESAQPLRVKHGPRTVDLGAGVKAIEETTVEYTPRKPGAPKPGECKAKGA